MGLFDRTAGQRRNQCIVANLLAEAGDHGGDLRIEQRPRHIPETKHKNLDVLSRRVEHLQHLLVGEQAPQRRQIDVGVLCVDHRHLMLARKLHDAQLGPIRALPHELGINGDKFLRSQPVAQGLECGGRRDQHRWRECWRGAGETCLVCTPG